MIKQLDNSQRLVEARHVQRVGSRHETQCQQSFNLDPLDHSALRLLNTCTTSCFGWRRTLAVFTSTPNPGAGLFPFLSNRSFPAGIAPAPRRRMKETEVKTRVGRDNQQTTLKSSGRRPGQVAIHRRDNAVRLPNVQVCQQGSETIPRLQTQTQVCSQVIFLFGNGLPAHHLAAGVSEHDFGELNMSLTEPYQQWRKRYDEYCVGDHWRLLKGRKFKECGRKCMRCKTKQQIHVHHVRYKNLVDVETTDLMVLCKDCHETLHSAIRFYELHIEDVEGVSALAMIDKFLQTDKGGKFTRKREIKKERVKAFCGNTSGKPKKKLKKLVNKAYMVCQHNRYSPDSVQQLINELTEVLKHFKDLHKPIVPF